MSERLGAPWLYGLVRRSIVPALYEHLAHDQLRTYVSAATCARLRRISSSSCSGRSGTR